MLDSKIVEPSHIHGHGVVAQVDKFPFDLWHRAFDIQRDATRRGQVPHGRPALAPRSHCYGTLLQLAPDPLPGTNLIITTSPHFAEYYARQFPLAVLAAPIDFPAMHFCQLWHIRTQPPQSHAWLRSLLSVVAAVYSFTKSHKRVK